MAIVVPDDVRQYLTLNTTQDEDLLQALCDGVDAFILSYLDVRSLERATFTERHSGKGGRVLVLDNEPIVSVISVKVDGIAIPAAVDYKSGYLFDTSALYLHGYRFTHGLMNVEVTYESGYEEMPADLKRAGVEIVSMAYQRRNRVGVSSKSIGQESISYAQSDITPTSKVMLAPYKKRFLSPR